MPVCLSVCVTPCPSVCLSVCPFPTAAGRAAVLRLPERAHLLRARPRLLRGGAGQDQVAAASQGGTAGNGGLRLGGGHKLQIIYIVRMDNESNFISLYPAIFCYVLLPSPYQTPICACGKVKCMHLHKYSVTDSPAFMSSFNPEL